jgi:hypothetical protein
MVKRGKLPSGRRRTEFRAGWWPDGASWRRWQGRSVVCVCERERWEEEKREERRKKGLHGGLNIWVTPTALARLSRATCFRVTGTHASYDIWHISRTTVVGAIESCYSNRRDWVAPVRLGPTWHHVSTSSRACGIIRAVCTGTTPSWVVPTGLTLLKEVRYWK